MPTVPVALPVSSSPSSCSPSSLLASESSCAPPAVSDRGMNNFFGNPLSSPPLPPLPLSESAPFSPSVLSSARFPPPPNSCLPQTYNPSMAFFEAQPTPPYPSELRAPGYDSQPEVNTNATVAYGTDNSPKCITHWPMPGFNSNNSNYGPTKSSTAHSSVAAPYPLWDSTGKSFVSKFPPSARDSSSAVSSQNAVIHSSSFASVSSPHFSSFPPPNLPFDFPHFSSRFSPSPHAFYPGLDPPPTFGPCNEEFLPYNEPMPSYLSRLASGPFPMDNFHDASSRPMHSPETAPRSIKSTSPSCFSGPHAFSGSSSTTNHMVFTHPPLSSRSNTFGPVCSSESSGIQQESSCEFPPAPARPFQSPVSLSSGTIFNPCNISGTPLQDMSNSSSSSNCSTTRKEEDRVERILSESGSLMYHQRMSPEEWRWNHYQATHGQGMADAAGFPLKYRHSTPYNHFQIMNRHATTRVDEAVSEDGRESSFGSNIPDRFKVQPQTGPSLKLAASALAEMLALSSTGASGSTGPSLMAHIASLSGTGLPSDPAFPVNSGVGEAFKMPNAQDRSPDDCCSSSGSAVMQREANDAPGNCKIRGLFGERSRSGPGASGILTRTERGNVGHVEGASCDLQSVTGAWAIPIFARAEKGNVGLVEDASIDFQSAPATWAIPRASGQSQSLTNVRPMTSWMMDMVPQVIATKGICDFNGPQSVFLNPTEGMKQTGCGISGSTGVLQELNLESCASENLNPLFTQSLTVSRNCESERFRKVTTQPVGAVSSGDDTSITGPFRANVAAFGPSMSCAFQEESSSPVESPELLKGSHNYHLPTYSTLPCTSTPLSHASVDPPHGPMSNTASGVTARLLANLAWSAPQSSPSIHTFPNPTVGTGSLSLTTSISNLSKVLLSFTTSALQQPDSVGLLETLQSSILRLSECLLLEQSRLNQGSGSSNFVASSPKGESSNCRHLSANGSLDVLGQSGQTAASGNSYGSNLRASQGCLLREAQSIGGGKQVCDAHDAFIKPGDDTVEVRGSNHHDQSGGSHRSRRFKESKSDADCREKAACLGAEDFLSTPVQAQFSELHDAGVNDIIEFLRSNSLLDREILKSLMAAEAREAKLKVVIQDLREELDFEREENKGTAFLCEKIMQEENALTVRTKLQAKQAADEERITSSRASMEASIEKMTNERSPKNEQNLSQLSAIGSSSGSTQARADDNCVEVFQETKEETSFFGEENENSTVKSPDRKAFNSLEKVSMQKMPVNSSCAFTELDQVESRLALLRARGGWDTEIGVFTETEPCTPANPDSSDLHVDTESRSISSPLGIHDDGAFTRNASLTSQQLVQSEVLLNMDAAWSQCYDYSELSGPVYEREVAENEMQQTSTLHPQAYDDSEGVEARALLIRSRPNWAESDSEEMDAFDGGEDLLGRMSMASGSARGENDRFETMDEICLVRLLDSDLETPQSTVIKGISPGPQGENEGHMLETLNSDSEAVKGILYQPQDLDEEPGWEHV